MADSKSPGPEPGGRSDPEKDPGSLVGSVLAGRYRLVQLLGSGAMGAVYVGEHLKIGRRDAIKVLRTSLARDPEAVARFTRGARNASAIRHPNVCTVYDFSDTSDGLQFLAMELVEGESLTSLLQREGPLPLERAVRITVQTASALEAAHELGIVHRDLKPDNIMIARGRDGGDVAKVVDFDIAKGSAEGESRGVTRLGFVVGTPEYMSPEQLTGDPLDGRSDVYSLGLVFFRMITGELPYRSQSTQELMVDRLTRDPLTLDDVAPGVSFPAQLQPVLDRALARNREGRPASAREFAMALWDVAFGSASPPGDTGPHARPAPLPATVVTPRSDASGSSAASRGAGVSRKRLIQGSVAAGVAVIVGLAVISHFTSGSDGAEPASLLMPSTLGLMVGDTARVDATALGPKGSVLGDATIAWTSDRPQVASVDATGLVHALQTGTASIRATSGSAQGVTEITVSSGAPASPPRLARRTLSFVVSASGAKPGAESVDIAGSPASGEDLVSDVSYGPGTPSGWLSAKLEGTSTPTTMTLEPVDPPTAAGRYDATVVVAWGSGGPADTLQVTLDVRARPGPRPEPARLSAAAANKKAWDQLFLLTDDQSEGARRAVKDTTRMLWDATYLPDSIRARAAYAYAQAAVELHEMSEGLQWARRASMLAPTEKTYRDYLRQLGGGSTP